MYHIELILYLVLCGMVKNLINMKKSEFITRSMLSKIRECINEVDKPKIPSLDEFNRKLIKEENEDNNNSSDSKPFKITKSTPQFGDIRISQEETLLKTIGENIELSDDGLIYYPNDKDLVLTGKISSLKIAFQFKYNDPSGDGCYIWANGLQLTETNNRTIGKIRDGFVNWKNNLIQNGDLLDKLHKAATK